MAEPAISEAAVFEPVLYRDRESGEVREEKVFGRRALELLYGGPVGRWLTEHLLTRPWVSRLYARGPRSRRSRRQLPELVRELKIDLSEAELPLAEYASWEELFCRRLHPEARPLAPDPEALVFPADGRVTVLSLGAEVRLRVKGCPVGVEELVGSLELARRYRGGWGVLVRLAVADYHRFHFPAAGVATGARRLGRRLHSVHPLALRTGAPAFRNRRSVSQLRSEIFGGLTLVEVGALTVGSIVQTYHPGPVARGGEKGHFRFGGSAVVLLVEAGRLRVDADLLAAREEGLEMKVKMGTRIGGAA